MYFRDATSAAVVVICAILALLLRLFIRYLCVDQSRQIIHPEAIIIIQKHEEETNKNLI